jgi:hypothetical protein
MSRSKRKLPLTPWSLGNIPVTDISVEEPVQQVDPNTERLAKLKSRAQELLVLNETAEREAEQRRQQAADAVKARIDAVRLSCRSDEEWQMIQGMVQNPEFYTRQQVLSGEAYELAAKTFREI